MATQPLLDEPAAEPIRYSVSPTRLGLLLIAATRRGVCLVAFGDTAEQLRGRLRAELPFAETAPDDEGLAHWARAIVSSIAGDRDLETIPLDVSGSRFQRRVWDALRRIPRGETRTYQELARTLGLPRGARAVARACATNPVPLVVPCHRIVPKAGGVGGYRYGPDRKRALLAREGAARVPAETPALP